MAFCGFISLLFIGISFSNQTRAQTYRMEKPASDCCNNAEVQEDNSPRRADDSNANARQWQWTRTWEDASKRPPESALAPINQPSSFDSRLAFAPAPFGDTDSMLADALSPMGGEPTEAERTFVRDQPETPAAGNLPMTRPFGYLPVEARNALLKTCQTGRVDCRAQPTNMKEKKSEILQREMTIYYEANESGRISYASRGDGGGGYGYDGVRPMAPMAPRMAEKRLDMIQTLKKALIQAAGMAGLVEPVDDGTFQQDILLTELQSTTMIRLLDADTVANDEEKLNARRYKRAALFLDEMPTERWEVSVPISYYLDETLEEYEKEMVRQALRTLQSATFCLNFDEQTTKPHGDYLYYVKVASPNFCGLSYIGKVKPLNPIYLSFACQDPVGVAMHETMHALGVLHQHLRADRDYYVAMQWSNINPQLYDYFAIADPAKFTSYGTRYDYGSIMHYAPYTGALDLAKPTMVPKFERARNLPRMGQRKALGPADIDLLNRMYCKSVLCRDSNVYCGLWAVRNLCTRRSQSTWMAQNCQKSCKMC